MDSAGEMVVRSEDILSYRPGLWEEDRPGQEAFALSVACAEKSGEGTERGAAKTRSAGESSP